MSYLKRIVCLANSRKYSERCVAGLELEGTQLSNWVRPVSSNPLGELSLSERKLADGSDPALLDILEVPLLEPCPQGCQTENHLIDRKATWARVGQFPRQQLLRYFKSPNRLWINGYSSRRGLNDRIPEEQVEKLPCSLVLVEPQRLRIEIRLEAAKLRVRAEFWLKGQKYRLGVTDPVVEAHCFTRPEGLHTYKKRAVACISIGEPFNGFCYKLVASIIPL